MGRAPEAPGSDHPDDSLVSGPPMSRRSLRPQLNQIRGWVRQGRTDAWIAHQLEVTVQQIQAFKREQGLEPDSEEPAQGGGEGARGGGGGAQGGRGRGRRGGRLRRGGEAQARAPQPRWAHAPPDG